MRLSTRLIITLCLAGIPLIPAWSAQQGIDSPNVTVSIKPLHSLLVGLMHGIAEPNLLSGRQSPHHEQFRPSQLRQLESSDLIIWVGPQLENTLTDKLQVLLPQNKILTLLEQPGFKLLQLRGDDLWGMQAQPTTQVDDLNRMNIDPHLWLSTDNVRYMIALFRDRLSNIDPDNRDQYFRNADRLQSKLDLLTAQLELQLGKVRRQPFLVYHDAFQYFENQFDLNSVGAVVVHADRKPGARRISSLRQLLIKRQAICLFGEPQIESRIIQVLLEGSTAGYAVLEPLGLSLEPGEDLWFILMRNLARQLIDCLTE